MARRTGRLLCVLALLVGSGAALAPAAVAEPCVATVAGTVWDSSPGTPRLPGLTVDVVDYGTGSTLATATTGSDGSYAVQVTCQWDPVVVYVTDPAGFYTPRWGFDFLDLGGVDAIYPQQATHYQGHVAMTPPARFVPVEPTRVFDTRTGSRGAVTFVSTESFAIEGLPADASAVVLNVTATQGTVSSFVTVSGDPSYNTPWVGGRPTTSSLNVSPGRDVANLVTVPVRADGIVQLYNDQGAAHLVVDLQGYYSTVEGAGFVPTSPVRALDTRDSSPLGAGEHRTLAFGADSPAPAPEGAVAAAVTLTSTEATAPTSYVSAGPAGGADVATSSVLNAYHRSDVPNLAIVPLGAGDAITLYNDQGSTHLIVDVVGWYVETGGAYYQPVKATRATGSGPIGPAEVREFPATGGGFTLPDPAVAVSFNLTTRSPSVGSYLTAYPSGATRPFASNANSRTGADVAAGVLVAADPGFSVYNDAGSVDVLVDVFGYFVEKP